MADVEVNGALEQRQRKAKKNEAVPSFDEAADLAPDADATPAEGVTEGETTEIDDGPSKKVYFVRVPRPPFNDEQLKKLQGVFAEHVTKLKAMNAKTQVKRNELRELRGQMGVARGLKDGSQPEYEEKLNRLKQLRDMRNKYIAQMGTIKENLRGLECKSEAELDAKIKELENKIAYDGVALREEKMIVQQISKLQQQRTAIRDYDNQKGSLTELEAEAQKIKAVVGELDGEFSILKAERDQAQGIMKEILTKVKAVEAELKEMEEEQSEVVKLKNDALAALDKARGEMNEGMTDYRENRSFSLKVRDLIAAGSVDEARALCSAQVDEHVQRYCSDKAFRKEYTSLWAQQRKFAVSELLPGSTTVVKEGGRDAGAAAGGKDGKGKAAAKPAKPQGAEKAKALIEALMAEASAEASRAPRQRVVEPESESGDADDEDELPAKPAAPVIPAGLSPEMLKAIKPAAAPKPVEAYKVELPVISNEAFVPPVVTKDAADASAPVDKEKLREEQMRKAAEAEARKIRLAQQKEVKRKQGEIKKVQEEARKKAEALAALQGQKAPAAAPVARAAPEPKSDDDAAPTSSSVTPAGLKPSMMPVLKSQTVTAAKRVKTAEPLPKRLKKLVKQHAALLAVIGVVALVLILVIMSASSSK